MTASADEIVHRIYRDPEVKRAMRSRWGASVLDAEGEVDRRAVGEIVFSDPSELEWLEGFLHPRVVEEQARWRSELDPRAVAVVEVPLLYETGGEERFDAVVVITAPEEVRAARTAVAGAAERSRRLIPDDEKVRRADFAYVNDGSLDELDAFVSGVLARLTA
jgi:dephospho-CoA kinase